MNEATKLSCENGNHIVKNDDSTNTCLQCGHRSVSSTPLRKRMEEILEHCWQWKTDREEFDKLQAINRLESLVQEEIGGAEESLEQKIVSLEHKFRQLSYHSGGDWIAKGKNNPEDKWHLFHGKSPVEAIDKLISSR